MKLEWVKEYFRNFDRHEEQKENFVVCHFCAIRSARVNR